MAATSTLKLVLDDKEYEANIRSAKQGMVDLQQSLESTGKTFADVDKQVVDYAKAIGEMETVSRSAKGKLNEMTQTFTELSVQYRQLTDEEKKSPFGKALSESLEQLRGRIQESKGQLDEVSRSLGNVSDSGKSTSGVMDALLQKFTVNIDAIKLFNIGLQAVEGALQVAKDAFFNNEEQLDEWGRIVESSTSLYNGFLIALNTGDISGFINNINNIVQAARSAYDALDALSTFNAFNQINVERTRTDLTESIVSFKEGNADKETVKAAAEAYKKELSDRKRLEREAYIETVGKVAQERGVSKQDLLDALSGSYGHYQDLKKIMPTGTESRYVPGLPGMAGRYDTFKVVQNDQERLGEALRHLNDTELQSLQALGAQAERTGNEIAQVDKQLVRVLNGKQGGSGGSGNKVKSKKEVYADGTVGALEKELQELGKAQKRATTTEEWKALQEQIRETTVHVKVLKGEMAAIGVGGLAKARGTNSVSKETFSTASKWVDKRETQLKTGKLDFKEVDEKIKPKQEKQDTLNDLNKVISGLQNVSSGLQQMGIKLPDGVSKVLGGIQGLMTVIQGVQSIISIFSTTTATTQVFSQNANTAAITALTGAVIANTAAVTTNTITPSFFSGGGVAHAASGYIVPGHSFSGDNVPAMLNSGETVLNVGQSDRVASSLLHAMKLVDKIEALSLRNTQFELNDGGVGSLLMSGGSHDGDGGKGYVSGQNIFIGTNNYLKGSGQGQLVTTRMLRQYGLIN